MIYVASSWRNTTYNDFIKLLREKDYEVYDFKTNGFNWKEIDAGFAFWDAKAWREALKHPLAIEHFNQDKAAMDAADICILLLPCGRSAHLEVGYMAAQGKRIFTLALDAFEPELMILLAGSPNNICITIEELLNKL